jgi:hypothetical protein
VWGHWAPADAAPDGYVWEPGFWDGDEWVEGFWRPAARVDQRWVSSAYDADGVYHAGYWQPIAQWPGFVWIPGWFDGETWIDGFWVEEGTYRASDPDAWAPDPDAEAIDAPLEDDAPLAIPAR